MSRVRDLADNNVVFVDGITTADITEHTNLFFTDARADARLALKMVDEDNMSSNSAAHMPTQQSVKAYVDTEVASLVDSSPSTLDTLNELAAALGDDANFSTTITNSIATKLPLAGGTMTGALIINAGDNGLDVRVGTDKRILFAGNIGEIGSVAGFQAVNTAGSANTAFGIRATDIRFATGSDERVRITDAGVGIGATSPSDKLEVSRTSTDQTVGLTLTNLQAGGYGSGIVWKSKRSDSPYNILDAAKIVVAGENSWNGDGNTASQMQFWTQKDNTLTKHMTLNKNGNLGIGDSNPTSLLSISKNSTRTTDFENMLKITHTSSGTTGVGFGSAIYFVGERENGVNQAMGRLLFDAEVNSGTNISSGFSVQTATAGSTSEKFRITHDGKVGIGTTDPTNVKLQLNKSGSDTVGDGHIGFGGGSTPLWAIRGGAADFDLRIDRSYGGWQSTPALSIRRMNGNVGVGLDTASTKLHVKSGGAGNSYGSLYLEIDSATNYPAMVIQTATGGNSTETHGLYIKNTAAGYGLRIDDTSGDTSPFVVDTEGRVGVGTTSPVSSVDIGYGTNGGWEGASSTPALAITQSDAYRGIALRTVGSSNIPATLSLERAQTSGAQTSDGDDLGRVLWNGSGGSYVNRVGASIKATQHGAYSGGYLPAKLDFFTSSTTLTHNGQNPASGAHTSRFRINPAGDQLINGQFNYHVISGTSSPNVAFSYDFYRATYAHPIKITCAISHWNGGYMSYTEGMYWGYNTAMSSDVHHSYNGGNGSWTISFPTNNIVRVRMNGDASYNYGSGWYIKLEGNLRREYTSA